MLPCNAGLLGLLRIADRAWIERQMHSDHRSDQRPLHRRQAYSAAESSR